jgi:hypothetical protein
MTQSHSNIRQAAAHSIKLLETIVYPTVPMPPSSTNTIILVTNTITKSEPDLPLPETEPEPVMDWDSLPDAYLHSHKIDEWDTLVMWLSEETTPCKTEKEMIELLNRCPDEPRKSWISISKWMIAELGCEVDLIEELYPTM